MVKKVKSPFQNEGIVKFFEKISQEYFNAPAEFYIKIPESKYVREGIIQKKENPDDETKIFFWLWRIQRYFFVKYRDKTEDSKTQTALLISGFIKELEGFSDQIKEYICVDEHAQNCLIFSVMLSRDKNDWDAVIKLIEQFDKSSPLLPLLRWCSKYYLDETNDSCRDVLDDLIANYSEEGPFVLPDSPISLFFKYVALSQWYLKNPTTNPGSSLRVLLPQENQPSLAVLPKIIEKAPLAELFSNNLGSIRSMAIITTRHLLSQFRLPSPAYKHSIEQLNSGEFKNFLNSFLVVTLDALDEVDEKDYLIGLSQLLQFKSPRTPEFCRKVYSNGLILVRKLFVLEQYLEAYNLYADLTQFHIGDDTQKKVATRSALYCVCARVDEWLAGDNTEPKFNAMEVEFLPEFKKLTVQLDSSEIPEFPFYQLAKRLGERFKMSTDKGVQSTCETYNSMISLYIKGNHLKEINALFKTPLATKVIKAEKNNGVAKVKARSRATSKPQTKASLPAPDPSSSNQPEDKKQMTPVVIKQEPLSTSTQQPIYEAKPSKANKKLSSSLTSEDKPALTSTDSKRSNKPMKLAELSKRQQKKEKKANSQTSKQAETKLFDLHDPKSSLNVVSKVESKPPAVPSKIVRKPQPKLAVPALIESMPQPKLALPSQVENKPNSAFLMPLANSALSNSRPVPQAVIDPIECPKPGEVLEKPVPALDTKKSLSFFSLKAQPFIPREKFIPREAIPKQVMRLSDELLDELADIHIYLSGAAPSNILDELSPNDYDLLILNSDLKVIFDFLKRKGFAPEIRSLKHPIIFCDIGEGITLDFTVKELGLNETIQGVLAEDYSLRDFNINALYCELTRDNKFKVFSFLNALLSRNAGMIECIQNPEHSFKEDPSRIFRLTKALIRSPKYVLDDALQKTLRLFKGKWMSLFENYIQEDPANIKRLNHAIRKLFARHSYTDINKTLDMLGGLTALTGLSLADVNLACSKIPVVQPESQFIYWVFANRLKSYELGKFSKLCPTHRLLDLTVLEQDCLRFIYDKAPGQVNSVQVYLPEILSLVEGFKLSDKQETYTYYPM